MASKEVTLSSQYSELNRFGQNGEYERALKISNKILADAPEEEEAFHCKVVCLIQLSRFQDALQAIIKQSKLSRNLLFEKAYCQYRLNQPSEALKTVNDITNLDQKLKELKAQILYRLEDYEECFDVYKAVIKNSNDDYEDERQANLAAVVANLCIIKSKKELPKLKENTFELAYNAACQLIAKGLYIDAEKKLKLSEKLCREALEEDGTAEEDIESEVGIIRGQLAYCLQMQGREKEAQAIYNAILKSKPSDIGLVAVASNNSVTINRDQNLFDSKKKMKNTMADGVEHKLTTLQKKNIAFNQCLLTVYTNQIEHGRNLCQRLSETYPECAADAALIQAVQLFRDNKIKEAAHLLVKFADSHKEWELEMKLACVQLLLTAGDKMEACKILESLGENGIRPGVISALVTLYLSENNHSKAAEIFKNAVDWYKNNKQSNQGDLSALWRQAADFHLRSGEPQVAANSLEELLRLNPGDNKTLAQLVIAYAQFDSAKAQNLSKQLPQLKLSGSIDVDLLENSNWMMGTKVLKKVTKVEASPKPGTPGGDELIHKKKKNKKRKGKLPKNYDPEVMPDPERWLPRHQRTGWKKKKDRRSKDVGKGTQGAATGASDLYDVSKIPNFGSKTTPNPNSPIAEGQGPRQQKRKFQQKKKKKGGKYYKLENFGFKSRLTLHDVDFVEDVEADIRVFTENQRNKRVLVFPPFNNFRRFLIHQLIESEFKDLKSFSIGEGEERRTVVCFVKDFKDPVTPSPPTKIVVEETKFISDNPVNDSETNSPQSAKRSKRVRTMPSVSIYRPPAARKLEQNANLPSIQARETVGGPSPEKSRLMKCAGDGKETGNLGGRKSETEGISVFRNAITSIRTQNKVPKCKNVESTNRKNESAESKSEEAMKIGVQNRQRRPDIQVYVPKHRRSANTSCNNSNNSNNINNVNSGDTKISICHDFEEKPLKTSEPEVSGPEEEEEEEVSPQNECLQKMEVVEVDEPMDVGAQSLESEDASKIKEPEVTIEDIRNEFSGLNNNSGLESSSQSCENSNPVDSKNGSASSGSDQSAGERVSDGDNGNSNGGNTRPSSGMLNPEECDWESMFDDTGECLDPSLLEQLTSAVGEVTIEKPKSKYKKFKNKTLDSVGDEFPHVVEIYNFPPEFQIQDLMTVFSQFKNSGFEIKWVDDTHALGIFSSSAVVSQVLSSYHPFVKTRLLKEGTALSKMKARRSAEFLLPYKPRPDTCPALARRLVTGALGVRLNTSREEREAERKLLTKAREKKRLEAKQKEDAWEGTFS